MSSTSKLVYAIAFQVGWFVCIMSGSLISSIYAALFLAIHLWYSTKPKHNFFIYSNLLKKEIFWILAALVLGLLIETISFSGGFLYFKTEANSHISHKFFEHFILPPLWLLNLWLIFAIALRTCLSFLFNNQVITYTLCIIFVPFNYYAGANLNGTVLINQPNFISLALITFLWLLFFACMLKIKQHYFEETLNAI